MKRGGREGGGREGVKEGGREGGREGRRENRIGGGRGKKKRDETLFLPFSYKSTQNTSD